ncbi:MAG: hypothetical protein AB7N24_22630 [Dehalococcoidia bacterium]
MKTEMDRFDAEQPNLSDLTAEHPASSEVTLRRRDFLCAVGSATLAQNAAAQPAVPPVDPALLVVRFRADSPKDVEVLYKDLRWNIDRHLFGQDAQFRIDDISPGERRVRIEGAQWRRAEAFQLEFNFVQTDVGWNVAMQTRKWPVAGTTSFSSIDIVDWMGGRVALRATLKQPSAQQALRSIIEDTVLCRTAITLTVLSDLTWSGEAIDAPMATASGPKLTFRTLRFRRLRQGSQQNGASSSEDPTPLRGSVASAKGTTQGAPKAWELGRHDQTATWLKYISDAALEWTLPDRTALPLSITLSGEALLGVRQDREEEGPFYGSSCQLTIRKKRDEERTSLSLVPASGPLGRSFRSRLSRLLVSGHELTGPQSAENQSCGDIQVEVQRGKLQRFGGVLRVQRASMRLIGSDFNELSFEGGGEPTKVRIDGVEVPSCQTVRSEIVLGRRASLRLSLDRARLQAARALDLMRLDFRFQGLALRAETGIPTIVRDIQPGTPLTQGRDHAVMTVELPPQHIAERAYFRALDSTGQEELETVFLPNVALDLDRAVRSELRLTEPTVVHDLIQFDPKDKKHWRLTEALKDRLDPEYRRFRKAFAADRSLRDKFGWDVGNADKEYVGGRTFDESRGFTVEDIADYQSRVRALMRDLQMRGDPREALEEVTGARLSGRSRVSFRIGSSAEHDQTIFDFTLQDLTDWSTMDLNVQRRAETVTAKRLAEHPKWRELLGEERSDLAATLLYQLEAKEQTAEQRMQRIFERLQPAGAHETSIELPFRLHLSPGQTARWRTSGLPVDAGTRGVPLWQMTLDEDAEHGTVRAIWSDDFRAAAFLPTESKERREAPIQGMQAPWLQESSNPALSSRQFRTTMDSLDRHQIVGLSSIHGLPVLPRVMVDGKLDLHQLEPPKGFELKDAAIGADRQAIYIPRVLSVHELSLSSLGGSLNLDTSFEPPAALRVPDRQPLFDAFSVERWRHRAVLGRDIEVELVYKGFLFPLGLRCSLVRLTERRFLANPVGGHPTAYLIQRMFLRIGRPDKTFPALGQPNGGRRWPAERMRLLTRRTPDILDATSPRATPTNAVLESGAHVDDTGRVRMSPADKGLIFWPRTGRGEYVRFEVQLDDSAGSVQIPMLFADNTAVKDERTLERLASYYNKLKGEDELRFRTVEHGGARRRYAPEEKSGQNTHTTHRWKLAVEGRAFQRTGASPVGENNYFATDPILEGADQPPFYPVMANAQLSLSQSERFSGSSEAPTWSAYAPSYVVSGFDEVANPALLYLEFSKGDEVPLRFSGKARDRQYASNGHRSGGVAQPVVLQNGLSRDHGPVHTSADAGQRPVFNSKEFFDSDAKVLGFIKLKDVIKSADFTPKLQERVDYGLAQIHEFACKDLIAILGATVDKLIEDVFETKTVQAQRAGSSDADRKARITPLLQLYPDVGQAARSCRDAIDSVRKHCLQSADDEFALLPLLSGVHETGRRLLAALSRASRDPLAPVRESLRELLRNYQLGLTGQVGDTLRAALGIQQLADLVAKQVGRLLSAPEFENWRRIVLAYPLPPKGIGLDDVAAQVDAWMVEQFGQGIRPDVKFDVAIDGAIMSVRARLVSRIEQASKGATADSRAALEAYRRLVEAEWRGASLVPRALPSLAGLVDRTTELMRTLQGVASSWDLVGINAVLEAIRQQQSAFQKALAELLEGALPAGYQGLPQQLCENGAAWLQNALLSMSFEERNPILAACYRAGVDGRVDLRKVLSRDHLRPQLAKIKDGPAKKWLDSIDAQLAKIASGLDASLRNLCRNADEVTRIRRDFAPNAKWPQTVCAPVAREALSLLPRLEAARSAVLQSTTEALRGLRDDSRSLKEILQTSPVDPTLSADTIEAIWKECGLALAATAKALLPWVAQTTLLGATAEVDPPGIWDRVTGFVGFGEGRRAELGTLLKGLEELHRQLPAARLGQEAGAVVRAIKDPGRGIYVLAREYVDTLDSLALEKAGLTTGEQYMQRVLDCVPLVEDLVSTTSKIELAVRQMLSATLTAESQVAAQLVKLAWETTLPILRGAEAVDSAVYTAWLALKDQLPKGSDGFIDKILAKILGRPLAEGSPINVAAADLLAEQRRLKALVDQAEPTTQEEYARRLSEARELLEEVQKRSAAIRLVLGVGSLSETVLSGDLSNLVDLDTPRRILEDQLKQLVPVRSSTRYKLGTNLDNGDFFSFEEADPGKQHLEIETEASVGLLDTAPRVTMKGRLAPITLNLLPGFEVARLTFSETIFESLNGSPPKFAMKLKTIKLGPAVSFLEVLQSFLVPKSDDGFYLDTLPGLSGIQAGYSINLGIISFGTMSFSNVSLGVGCVLPFNDGKPVFTAQLGRRDAPFLISVAPYGGGGFVQLQSDGERITGFDLSFEFGGVGAFSFGPLKGQGRITTGIFIRNQKEMDGLFFCGGSANVACFGIAASLAVRMRQDSGQGMAGQATFSYSFSVGFAKIKFHVTVAKKESKPKEKTAANLLIDHTETRFARASYDSRWLQPVAYLPIGASTSTVAQECYDARLTSRAVSQSEDWRTYRNYFDGTLVQEV